MRIVDLVALAVGAVALASLMAGEPDDGAVAALSAAYDRGAETREPGRVDFLSRPYDVETMRLREGAATR